jgi:hypothetical protein
MQKSETTLPIPRTTNKEVGMTRHTWRAVFVLMPIFLAFAVIGMATDAFRTNGIALVREARITFVDAKYGTITCTAREYKGWSENHVVLAGRSTGGLYGGMIYTMDPKSPTSNLYDVYSVWGGALGDAVRRDETANILIAAKCQSEMRERGALRT